MASGLRRVVDRAAEWLIGPDVPVAGYLVSSSGGPGGVRDSDLTVGQVYDVLDEAFNDFYDVAVASLAAGSD